MDNFRINPDILTVIKPLGKPLSFKIGELIKAEILDILASGAITLKIKGSTLTAKTDIPIKNNTDVIFKVLGSNKEGTELKLQFLGYVQEEIPPQKVIPSDNNALNKIIQDIGKLFPKNNISSQKCLELLEHFIKELPDNLNNLSSNIKTQFQEILKQSLGSSGKSIISRFTELLQKLPDNLVSKESFLKTFELYKKNMIIDIEKFHYINLKNSLQGTGVILETKLKLISHILNKIVPPDISKQQIDISETRLDLKAQLLQLKSILISENKEDSLELVNGLIKDIETYQVLSKLTDSFYTFIPIFWDRLINSDIRFKKNKKDISENTFSCRIDLDLEEQGILNIMVLMNNKSFTVYFRAENDTFLKQLRSHINELDKRFKESGLNLGNTILIDKKFSVSELDKISNFEGKLNIKI